VAKTTVYRRWRSKEELALAVILEMTQQIVRVRERGDTRTVLIAFLRGVIRVLTTSLMGRVMQGLASDVATDPQLGHYYRERVIALRMAEIRRLVDRGIERGELRGDVDIDTLHEMLFGPIYHRLLLSGGNLDDSFAGRIVDAILPSIAASGYQAPKPRRARRTTKTPPSRSS
jgi:AcrR family transcriptional regulator